MRFGREMTAPRDRRLRLRPSQGLAPHCCIGDWSWSSLRLQRPEWLRDKKVNLLLQGSLEPAPDLPHVPQALDFVRGPLERKALELYFTQKTMARPIITPPRLPAERIQLLRKALADLGSDRAFLADAEKSRIEVKVLDGAAVDKVVALISSCSPEVRAIVTRKRQALSSQRPQRRADTSFSRLPGREPVLHPRLNAVLTAFG